MTAPRLRQLVIAAETLEAADQLGELLELGAPFVDPGVKEFGLENRVYALGDQFLKWSCRWRTVRPRAAS